MHGRERESAACREALWRGPAPAAVVIAGEPGIGKTTLFRDAAAEATAAGRRVLSTTGLHGDVDMPLANLVDLLDPAVRDVLPQLPAVQADALRVVLRLRPVGENLDEFLIARATVNALRALAETGPVLLAADDAQWLDPDSQRLLSTAAVWLTDTPVVWLLAVRTGHADQGLAKVVQHELAARSSRVELSGMDGATLCELIIDRFSVRWSPALLRHIAGLSGGNPYVALELARGTIAAGGHDAPDAAVPASLADSLRAGLNRLGPSALAVVEAAAVTARPTRPLLRLICGADADAGVDAAVDAGVLQCRPPDPQVAFAHPLLREVAVASIGSSDRRRLHLAWSRAVPDADEAAGHLAAGTAEPDAGVAAAVEAAARRLAARSAVTRAARLTEAALALTPGPSGPAGWDRRMMVLDILEKAGERDRARALAEKWAAADPPDAVRGDLTCFRGLLALDWDTRLELIAQAVGQIHNLAVRAHVGALLATFLCNRWRFAEAVAPAQRAVEDAEASGAPEVLRWALAARAEVAEAAGDADAGQMLAAALALPGWTDMWIPVYSPEMVLAQRHLCRGELDPARRQLSAVHEAGERDGRDAAFVGTKICLMILESYAGRWAEVEAYGHAVRRFAKINDDLVLPAALADSLLAVGRGAGDAREVLRPAIRRADAEGDLPMAVELRGMAAHLELSADDVPVAMSWLEPVVAATRRRAFADLLTVGVDRLGGAGPQSARPAHAYRAVPAHAPPNGASPSWPPGGTPTRRSPPPCCSARRRWRPT